jgi:hypothetical protein
LGIDGAAFRMGIGDESCFSFERPRSRLWQDAQEPTADAGYLSAVIAQARAEDCS